jgi:hypothetical protein
MVNEYTTIPAEPGYKLLVLGNHGTLFRRVDVVAFRVDRDGIKPVLPTGQVWDVEHRDGYGLELPGGMVFCYSVCVTYDDASEWLDSWGAELVEKEAA